MIPQWSVWALVALAMLAANLPFLSERVLLVGPRRRPKAMGWRLLELLLLAGLTLLVGVGLESLIGQRAPQAGSSMRPGPACS